MPDFLVRYFLLSVQNPSWFSRLSSQLSLAVAQRYLTFPGKIDGLAKNPRGLLQRVEGG